MTFSRLLAQGWHYAFGHDRRPTSSHEASNFHSEILEKAYNALSDDEREQFRALARVIAIRPSQFLYELAQLKDLLVRRLSLDEAFGLFRHLLRLAPDATLEHLPVRGLYEVVSRHATVFREVGPSGISFGVEPPRVIGAGDQLHFDCITRSLYVACLSDAYVHGRSAFIQFRRAALLDFEEREFDRVDDQLNLDLPVLQATKEAVWISSVRNEAIQFDEVFNLLGPHTPQFGHWIWEYMPKYVAATMSADISNVPVLVDAHMPNTHREFLAMVVPRETEIVEIPYTATVHVRRLWCAPRLFYVPLYPKTVDPLWLPHRTAPPDRFAVVIREIWRRMEPKLPTKGGPERIFLARKPEQQRRLLNRGIIEAHAERHGFVIVYPQDLAFAEQIQLMRSARYIVGHAGSALLLCFFARPGAKLCILSSINIFRSTSYTCLLQELGVDTTILTGPVASETAPFTHLVDYTIPEDTFRAFLDDWLT